MDNQPRCQTGLNSYGTSLCPMSLSWLPDPCTSGPRNLTATQGFGLLGPAPNLAFYLGVPVISLVDTILLLLNYISLLLHLHQIQSSKCSLNMPPSVRDAHCTVYSYSCIRYGHIPYEKRALTVWYGFCLYPISYPVYRHHRRGGCLRAGKFYG